jgi:cytochrome c oxidase assembly protein subunit 15
MVKSGLADRVEVSQYRLVAHLALALAIYAVTLWIALGILEKRKLGSDRSAGILPAGRPEAGDPGRPDRTTAGFATSPHPNPPAQAGEGVRFAGNLLPRERRRVRAGAHWRRGAEAIIALVALTIVAGGFVAGLKAGLTYNTFPLMDGRLVPAGYAQFQPFVLNWFENVAAAQFNHRLLAETTAAGVLILWLAGQRAAMPHPARLALHALFAAAVLQFALGVSTLLLVVPVPLGAAHQAGAVLLLTTALVFRHALRLLPRPVKS